MIVSEDLLGLRRDLAIRDAFDDLLIAVAALPVALTIDLGVAPALSAPLAEQPGATVALHVYGASAGDENAFVIEETTAPVGDSTVEVSACRRAATPGERVRLTGGQRLSNGLLCAVLMGDE